MCDAWVQDGISLGWSKTISKQAVNEAVESTKKELSKTGNSFVIKGKKIFKLKRMRHNVWSEGVPFQDFRKKTKEELSQYGEVVSIVFNNGKICDKHGEEFFKKDKLNQNA